MGSRLLLLLFCTLSCTAQPQAQLPPNTGGSSGASDAGGASGNAGSGGVGGIDPCSPPIDEPEADPPFDDSACPHVPVVQDCRNGFCRIPAGCFVIGSPPSEQGRGAISEERAQVTLTHDFEIQAHEVTQAEWTALGLHNPSGEETWGRDCMEPTCPVGHVNWFEAVSYANLLSERHEPPLEPCYRLSDCEGQVGYGLKCASVETTASTLYECTGYRLPTDAEWEYAVRAGTRTTYYSGPQRRYRFSSACCLDENADRIAWYCNNSGHITHPVAQKQPNAWGLYDMSGNATEWLNDHHTGQPWPNPSVDPGAILRSCHPHSFWVLPAVRLRACIAFRCFSAGVHALMR
jgi:sulfatase modifying factor 1